MTGPLRLHLLNASKDRDVGQVLRSTRGQLVRERGHVVVVLEGTLVTELSDGRRFVLTQGMSYHVADGRRRTAPPPRPARSCSSSTDVKNALDNVSDSDV